MRALVLDWTRDGRPAHVCAGECDGYLRRVLGCGLDRTQADAGAWCPGWLRTQPIWDEVALALEGAQQPGTAAPWKLLEAARLYRACESERAARAAAEIGDVQRD